jgi:hypothetical protein
LPDCLVLPLPLRLNTSEHYLNQTKIRFLFISAD